MNIIYTVLGI